jgi:hypothetical protein
VRKPNDASAFRNVYLRPNSRECPSCGRPREFLWNGQRYVRFVGDRVRIDYHVYVCTNGDCPLSGIHVKPEAVTMHVLPGREFGLDVIALIGYYRLGMSLGFPKIARALSDVHGVEISRREVEDLFNLYVALSTTDVRTDERLRAKLVKQGRVVLSVDAAKPERDGEALWLLRDQLSQEVLMGFVARNIDAETLAARIREVASLGIPIAGVVSDGEPVIVDAVSLALPGKPHGLCQYHFLVNFAKEVTSFDSGLKKHLAEGMKGISRFEDAAEATPSKRPTETDIRGPASLTLQAGPPNKRSKKGGAGGSTRGSSGRRAGKRRSSLVTSAK